MQQIDDQNRKMPAGADRKENQFEEENHQERFLDFRTVGFIVFLFSFPLLNPFFLILLPAVMMIAILDRRTDVRRLGLLGTAAVLVLLHLSGEVGIVKFALVAVSFIFVILVRTREKLNFLVSSLSSVLLVGFIIAVYSHSIDSSDIVNLDELYQSEFNSARESFEEIYLKSDFSDEQREFLKLTLESSSRVLILLLPGIIALLIVSGQLLALRVYRRFGLPVHQLRIDRSFSNFRFNDHWIWFFVLGLIGLLIFDEGLVYRLEMNLFFVMANLYFLRGMAVSVSLLRKWESSKFFKIVFVAFLFLSFPPFFLLLGLVIGLLDTWYDLRRIGMKASKI